MFVVVIKLKKSSLWIPYKINPLDVRVRQGESGDDSVGSGSQSTANPLSVPTLDTPLLGGSGGVSSSTTQQSGGCKDDKFQNLESSISCLHFDYLNYLKRYLSVKQDIPVWIKANNNENYDNGGNLKPKSPISDFITKIDSIKQQIKLLDSDISKHFISSDSIINNIFKKNYKSDDQLVYKSNFNRFINDIKNKKSYTGSEYLGEIYQYSLDHYYNTYFSATPIIDKKALKFYKYFIYLYLDKIVMDNWITFANPVNDNEKERLILMLTNNRLDISEKDFFKNDIFNLQLLHITNMMPIIPKIFNDISRLKPKPGEMEKRKFINDKIIKWETTPVCIPRLNLRSTRIGLGLG